MRTCRLYAEPVSRSDDERAPRMIGLIIDGMATGVSSPVLIGRAPELGRLRAVLALARDGQSSTTIVAGEAGVGKTRLTAEFVTLAREGGAVVLKGGCIDVGEGALPYAPVIDAMRGLARHTDPGELEAVLGDGRSDLARLIPDLGPIRQEPNSK